MNVLSTAAREYANRPKDEAYADLPAMISAAQHERDLSREVSYNLRDLRIVSTSPDDPMNETETSEIQIMSPKGAARFTHWSFGQFCRIVGAPAGYLRELPARIAAQALNFGINEAATGTAASLLVRAPNGRPEPIIRSVTSDSYSRVWDSELYDTANRTVFSHSSIDGEPWIAPPTWSGDVAGTWRGDRDSFVIRVDGGSIVTDPSVANRPGGGDGRMYRGILMRNSEVGAAGLLIDWVLFEYVCGNLNLWGAVVDRRFRRRHVGRNALRDTVRELGTLARQWTERSASQDETIIRSLMSHELAHSEAAVLDELKKIGYTAEQAKTALSTCAMEFSASPWSYWGIAQGTTRASQQEPYQDARHELDQLAAKLLARGRNLVAA